MAYQERFTCTIDHTKVPNTDRTNFPVPVYGTFADLKTVINGGKVISLSGYDIAFFSDALLTTKLNHETVSWSATTGAVVYYVQVPTVKTASDTVFYLAFSNPLITTDQSNATGTWDANFTAVYHLGDGTTLSLNDSTSNAATLTNNGSVPAVAGPFGGAASFNGTTQYLLRSASAVLTAYAGTISVLFNAGTAVNAVMAGVGNAGGGQLTTFECTLDGADHAKVNQPGGNAVSGAYTGSVWNYAAARFVNATSRFIHLNGAAGVQNTSSVTPNTPTATFLGARNQNAGISAFYTGSLGEVRYSNVDRGADWIATEYNSLLLTFVTVGSEVAIESGEAFYLRRRNGEYQ